LYVASFITIDIASLRFERQDCKLLLADALATPSLPAIITAVAASLTAIGGLIAAFALLIPILRITKTTHKIVNQQQTDLRNYQRALIEALKNANIQVPEDQSRTNGGA
jgi:beta-lactamase regulating signal transducer with metallopeptidase domain